MRFLMRMTEAGDGLLLVRRYDAQAEPVETCRVYDAHGETVPAELVPFAHSIAGNAVSMQEPCVINDLSAPAAGSVELQPFERGRRNLLALPLLVGPGVQAVIELFDAPAGRFRPEDLQRVRAAADIGTELLRQAIGHRQAQRLLLDAVEAALGASAAMDHSLHAGGIERLEEPPPPQVLDQLLRRAGESGRRPGRRGQPAAGRSDPRARFAARRAGAGALHHAGGKPARPARPRDRHVPVIVYV